MRTDVIKTYQDVHSWVGIIAGLALFIAFYAGAITMFEEPLNRWASAPTRISPPPSLQQTPVLIDKVLRARPDARTSYFIHLETGPDNPARLSWKTGSRRAPGPTYLAALKPDGALEIVRQAPSPVAQFIDTLHQHVGLPFPPSVSRPIMGIVSLLYAVAIVSGVICLLPSLLKDLFALRFGKNLKRMWLDVHNVLGLFSLPFHIIMALTAVIFAFHDQIYMAQGYVQSIGGAPTERRGPPPGGKEAPPAYQLVSGTLTPLQIKDRVDREVPGFALRQISYDYNVKEGSHGHIAGVDPRYGVRAPTTGIGEINTRTGEIIEKDYLPGVQDGWFATVTSFFALHFGSFGGNTIRWSYFILGLAGAFLFYSGNLLWIESRRKKERKAGAVEQSRSTRVLGALTVGVPLGSIIGISLTIAAAKLLPAASGSLTSWHSAIYYAAFIVAVVWALLRGAARSGCELLYLSALSTICIPLAGFVGEGETQWHHDGPTLLIYTTAIIGAVAFAWMAWAAKSRAMTGPRDSVWSLYRQPLVIGAAR